MISFSVREFVIMKKTSRNKQLTLSLVIADDYFDLPVGVCVLSEK